MSRKKCSRCSGRGWVPFPYNGHHDDRLSYGPQEVKCPQCNGTGWVEVVDPDKLDGGLDAFRRTVFDE